MIRIDVEDYCHACMDFSPAVIKPTREVVHSFGHTEPIVIQSDTIVQCEYRKRCDAIKKYLMRQSKEEEAVG